MFTRLLVIIAICLAALPAYAQEGHVENTDMPADEFIYLPGEAHLAVFSIPDGWTQAFIQSASFFAERYGDTTDIYGTVVIYGPPEGEWSITGDSEEKLSVLARKLFPLGDIGTQPGWYEVMFDPVELPSEFAIAVFTFSNDERGVSLGLTGRASNMSNSTQISLGKMSPANIDMRDDGSEWMINAELEPTLRPEGITVSAELAGPHFAMADDGAAEGFLSFQHNGPLVQFTGDKGRTIEKVWVYAQLAGDWFETDKYATVYLMRDDFRLIGRRELSYSGYTNSGSWRSVEFDGVESTEIYYVLIQPNATTRVELQVGYDSSGENLGSYFGTTGGILQWNVEAPEASTNWMVRVQYAE